MLTYNLSGGGDALYKKLYQNIKNDIGSGALRANEKLPSRRSLAENLGVSTVTVDGAYSQLIDEGYIYALPKKGYYVSEITPVAFFSGEVRNNKENERKSIGLTASESYESPGKAGLTDLKHGESGSRDYFDFSSNKPDSELFPFSVWSRLMRDNLSARRDELLDVSFCSGVYELRRAISGHLSSFRGMDVDPYQIIVGAGTEYLYGLIIRLIGKDKRYSIENPGYKKLARIYDIEGADFSLIPMDADGIVINALKEAHVDIAHVSPTHHFPSGVTMPIARRSELLMWANSSDDRYIIEDDYDSEFRLRGRPIPPLQSIDTGQRVVYMNTFSKSLASTIRISYMVLPMNLAKRFYDELGFYSCTVPTFEQYTLADFISKGYFEKHINRMRLRYSRKREEILRIIRDELDVGTCKITENDSGLHFILQLNSGLSDEELKRALFKKKIKISAISDYYIGDSKPPEQGLFILDYSNMDTDSLRAALAAVRTLL